MGDGTGISWTDATWNPIRGCSRVSEGCRNCYAERVAARFSGPGQPYEGLAEMRRSLERIADFAVPDKDPPARPRWTGEVHLIPEHLADPLRWKKPRRVFVNSMSDLFHEKLSNEDVAAVFGVMAAAPNHTFQVLTKRARRMREWFEEMEEQGDLSVCLREAYCHLAGGNRGIAIAERLAAHADKPWPLPNVWLGVSVENQAAADERIPELLCTPAAIRFLSCEPLIGEVHLHSGWMGGQRLGPQRINWVIAGCESGPGARECNVQWLRSLRDQCADSRVPFFLKQAREEIWTRALYPSAQAARVTTIDVGAGEGSKYKGGRIIELPYLDGVQHTAFPQ